MRIAVHADGRTIRGNENQLLLIVRGLVARGHQVHAACVRDTPVAAAFAAAGAHVSHARPRGDADLLNGARFLHWLRRLRPDAVLLTSWKRASLSAALARMAGAPRVVLRIGGAHGARRTLGDRVRRHALRNWVDDVYVNSAALGEHLRARVPGLERVRVIPNAVPPYAGPSHDLRAELGLPPDARIVFSAGAIEWRKGHDVLLTAFAALPQDDVHLAIAGDGPERAALRAAADSLRVASRVHLLGHRHDVRALLAATTVFALASRSDSMPNAVLEAAAAGLPIVCTDVPGTAEVLAPRLDAPAAGWIVPVGDAAALAAALGEALEPEAADVAREARRRSQYDHSPERLVERVEALLSGTGTVPRSPR